MKWFWEILGKRIDLLILLMCLGVTFGVWQIGILNDNSSLSNLKDNKESVEVIVDSYKEHLLDYLAGVKGLFEASNEVSEQELSSFVKTMLGDDSYPAILRFTFVEAVENPEAGATQFEVKMVVGQHGEIYSPSGQDLMSESRRKAMIEKIIQTTEPAMTWVETVTNIEEYKGEGFIVSMPFYRKGKLLGLINMVLSKEAIEQIFKEKIDKELAWVWSISEKGIIAQGEHLINGKKKEESVIFEMPGQGEWKIDLTVVDRPSVYWNMAMGIGVFLSFVIYTAVYGLFSAKARGESLAMQMTKELSEKKEFIEKVMKSLIIGVAVNKISSGETVYVNDAFENIYGWKKEEIASVEEFFNKVYPDIETRKTIKQRIMTDIESGDPLKMRWKDVEITTSTGERKFVDATNIPLPEQDLMVSTVVDVTSQKEAEEERLKHVHELESLNKLMVGRELKMIELKKEIENIKNSSKT